MKRLSIRHKLLGIVLAAAIGPAVVGLYAFNKYETVLDEAISQHQQSNQLLDQVRRITNNFQAQNIAWSNLLLRGHVHEQYNFYLSEFYDAQRNTSELAKELGTMLNGNGELKHATGIFLSKLASIQENYRKALDIYNQSDEPHFDTDHYLAPFVNAVFAELENITDTIEKNDIEKNTTLNTDINHQKTVLLLLMVFSTLIIISLFLWFFDINIGKPLANAINTATRIADGEISTRVNEDTTSEFSVFAQAFNHMLDNLAATNAQLEVKVDQLLDEVKLRRTAERKILAQKQSLQESKKLIEMARQDAVESNHAKSEFLSRMSHELRTPMNAILGFAQILEMEELSDSQKESVEEILAAGKHLLNLINEVLDLSKIESGMLEVASDDIDMTTLVNQCLALVKSLADKRGIRIEVNRESFAGLYALADFTRCKEVVINLLSNAIKYGNTNGYVWVFCRQEDNMLMVSVCDNGPGIPKEHQHEMFQAFNRLDAKNSGIEGTGIGLVISKRLATAMGGDLVFESEPHTQTCFTFSLPAMPEHKADILPFNPERRG